METSGEKMETNSQENSGKWRRIARKRGKRWRSEREKADRLRVNGGNAANSKENAEIRKKTREKVEKRAGKGRQAAGKRWKRRQFERKWREIERKRGKRWKSEREIAGERWKWRKIGRKRGKRPSCCG